MYTFQPKQKQLQQQQQKQQHYVVSNSWRGSSTNMEFNKKTGESYGLNGSGSSSSGKSNHIECASTNQSMAFGGSRKSSVGSGSELSEDYEDVKPDIKVSSHLLDHGYGYGVTPQYHPPQQQQQQQPSHHHHSSSSTSSNSHNSSSQQNSNYSRHHSPSASGSGASSRSGTATTPTRSHHAKQSTPNRTAGLHQQHKSVSGDPQITNYFKVSCYTLIYLHF